MKYFRALLVAVIGVLSLTSANAAGYFEASTKTLFSGWACNPATPNYSGWIHFWRDDGKFLGALYAANNREPAVGAICGDSGAHGFSGTLSFPTDFLDNKWHKVQAFFINSDNTNFELQNSVNVLFDGGVTPPPPPPPAVPLTLTGCNISSPGANWVATEYQVNGLCSTPQNMYGPMRMTYQYVGADSKYVYESGHTLIVCSGRAPAGWYSAGVVSSSLCEKNYYGYQDNAFKMIKY